jgi:hypothetical protein
MMSILKRLVFMAITCCLINLTGITQTSKKGILEKPYFGSLNQFPDDNSNEQDVKSTCNKLKLSNIKFVEFKVLTKTEF